MSRASGSLAVKLIESGWSVEELHRYLMTSRTYLQASVGSPGALAAGHRAAWELGGVGVGETGSHRNRFLTARPPTVHISCGSVAGTLYGATGSAPQSPAR